MAMIDGSRSGRATHRQLAAATYEPVLTPVPWLLSCSMLGMLDKRCSCKSSPDLGFRDWHALHEPLRVLQVMTIKTDGLARTRRVNRCDLAPLMTIRLVPWLLVPLRMWSHQWTCWTSGTRVDLRLVCGLDV
jgi:hypothetical protein